MTSSHSVGKVIISNQSKKSAWCAENAESEHGPGSNQSG
jgi:hypothetical protein